MRLVDGVLAGSHAAAARLISLLEDGAPEAHGALRRLYPHTGRAYVVGVTGPPGTGKSTLVDALIRLLRRRSTTVGVVAVDPSSPFTGGAILGDRIRMQEHSTDPGVFIRSMATRGSLGGLAPAAQDAVRVLDALGSQVIFAETVGTGQAEVDVMGVVDTVVLVTVPGLGDAVQTLKAGIMEIGEVFAVNKADRGEADRAVTEIKMMLGLAERRGGWDPPVVKVSGLTGEGVPDLLAAVEAHRTYQEQSGMMTLRREGRRRAEILRIAGQRVQDRMLGAARRSGRLEELARRAAAGEIDPYTAAEMLVAEVLPGPPARETRGATGKGGVPGVQGAPGDSGVPRDSGLPGGTGGPGAAGGATDRGEQR